MTGAGLYLFCATGDEGLSPGPSLAGWAGEPVEALPFPPLVLWIQPLRAAPERSAESVLTHHRVVDEAWRRAPALAPMRFGQWFRDREALREALEPRLAGLAEDLESVRDAGEHVVRLSEVAPPAEAEPTEARTEGAGRGRAHLEALAARERSRRAREERARAVAAELARSVGTLARDERVEPLHGEGLVSVAHLVARADEGAWAEAVEAFVDDHPELDAVRGGPWPPYSFVS